MPEQGAKGAPLGLPRVPEYLSGSQGMALLCQHLRCQHLVPPSPPATLEIQRTKDSGDIREPAPSVTDCVSRHASPGSALTCQSADGAKNVQPAPNPAESARHYQTGMAVAKRDTNQHLNVQMTTVTVLEVTQSHLTFVSCWNHPL